MTLYLACQISEGEPKIGTNSCKQLPKCLLYHITEYSETVTTRKRHIIYCKRISKLQVKRPVTDASFILYQMITTLTNLVVPGGTETNPR